MIKNDITIIMLMLCLIISGISCSKDAGVSTLVIKKKNNDERNSFYPGTVNVVGDSIVIIGFMQTAVPYYLNLNDPNSRKNLKVLKKAKMNMALVKFEVDKTVTYGKIIDVELAPDYMTEAFQKSLHYDRRPRN